MKIRAGVVSVGLADHVLNPLVTAGKRVHLVGHSFGGRLMTSATAAVDGKISNLSVLEGAFSHNAPGRICYNAKYRRTPIPNRIGQVVLCIGI